MSILGYSSSYFFPEYWSNTPLYGEKIIPLIDYILSADFAQADKLANAFYTMENKYKNTGDLPIDAIKEIINESGYSYVLQLLGEDENSIRLLVYLLVLIHQLKGTKLGIETVLNLLKRDTDPMVLETVGDPDEVSVGVFEGFTPSDFIFYNGFTVDSDPFEIMVSIRTPQFIGEQAIASSSSYGLYIGINSQGRLLLKLGNRNSSSWGIISNGISTVSLLPNHKYDIKLTFDGYEYDLKVSEAGKNRFTDYIVVPSTTVLGLHKDRLYLGVASNNGTIINPFRGQIDITPFSTNIQNIKITQWFETPVVGEENTFRVKADLDLGAVSTDFFENFANFVEKYVYPTLEAFEAQLKLQNNITFIPWNRQRITYVASADVQEQSENWFRERAVIDSEFSSTSTNALQNKVVSETIGDLSDLEN